MEAQKIEPLVVGLAEASKLLKIDIRSISKKLETGEIDAYRDGRNWKIPKTLLQKYVEEKAIAEAKKRRESRGEES